MAGLFPDLCPQPDLVLALVVQALGHAAFPDAPPHPDGWELFHSAVPEEGDRVVCVTATDAKQDGRVMSGERFEHPGFQVWVRGPDDGTARVKATALMQALDKVYCHPVTVDGRPWTVQNVSRTTSLVFVRPVEAGRRRDYVFNGYLTIF